MTVEVLLRELGQPMTINERNTEQRLLIEIAEAMERTKHPPLRQIDLHYDAGRVILMGLVPTYFLKQLAQATAMSVPGVDRIENQLRVADGQSHQPDTSLEAPRRIGVRKSSLRRSNAMLAYG
jgi:osmotically-inducible protein OsmY